MVEKVCVTGAGGFLGSWVVKILLSNGCYSVHGTVRNPSDQRHAHLNELLETRPENFKLFKADLLDYDSLLAAILGCTGVFHVASPVPSSTSVLNPEEDLIEPAVKGTLNVLRACQEAKVKRVVIVSSLASVMMNPSWPKDQVKNEACWSSKEYCRTTKNWYCLSKTEAESGALQYAKRTGLDVVTVCPSLILGPVLQTTLINASSLVLLKLLKGECESVENKLRIIVDVRDASEALVLAYEKPEAEGRYICTGHEIKMRDLVNKLKGIYPNYNYPTSFVEVDSDEKLSSEKLQKLGWSCRPLEETVMDSVQSYIEAGFLH